MPNSPESVEPLALDTLNFLERFVSYFFVTFIVYRSEGTSEHQSIIIGFFLDLDQINI